MCKVSFCPQQSVHYNDLRSCTSSSKFDTAEGRKIANSSFSDLAKHYTCYRRLFTFSLLGLNLEFFCNGHAVDYQIQ